VPPPSFSSSSLSEQGTGAQGCPASGWKQQLDVAWRGVESALAGQSDQIVTCWRCRIQRPAEGIQRPAEGKGEGLFLQHVTSLDQQHHFAVLGDFVRERAGNHDCTKNEV
jgi:hypothetical protein